MSEIEIATTTGLRKTQVTPVAKTPFVIFNCWKNGMRSVLPWSVTHAHTGYAAVHARTKAGARIAARQLAALGIDWAQSPEEIRKVTAGHRETISFICAQAAAK